MAKKCIFSINWLISIILYQGFFSSSRFSNALRAPIAVWPLESTHAGDDISGNGNHGTVNSGSFDSSKTPLPGVLSNSLEDPSVDIPLGSQGLVYNESFTIAGYFRAKTSFAQGAMVSYGSDYTNSGQIKSRVQFIKAGSNVRINARAVRKDGGGNMAFPIDPYVPFNTWVFMTFSYDYCKGTHFLWKDGVLLDTKYVGSHEIETRRDVRLGTLDGSPNVFEGHLSCIQMYTYAFSQDEVNEAAAPEACLPNYPYISSAQSSCEIKTSKAVRVGDNKALQTNIIKTVSVRTLSECLAACARTCTCVTFNLGKLNSATSTRLCQLVADKDTPSSNTDFAFYEVIFPL